MVEAISSLACARRYFLASVVNQLDGVDYKIGDMLCGTLQIVFKWN